MARRAGAHRARPGFRDALSRPLPRRGRARAGGHARHAGRVALAGRRRRADGPGRRGGAAPSRPVHGPRPAGACARMHRKGAPHDAGNLAGALGQRPSAGGGAQPARHLGPLRAHPLWPWPALFHGPDHAVAARNHVHAGAVLGRPLRAADPLADGVVVGARLGGDRPALVYRLRRRGHGRGDERDLRRPTPTLGPPPPRLRAPGAKEARHQSGSREVTRCGTSRVVDPAATC